MEQQDCVMFPHSSKHASTSLVVDHVSDWESINGTRSGAIPACGVKWPPELNEKGIPPRNVQPAVSIRSFGYTSRLFRSLSYIWDVFYERLRVVLLPRTHKPSLGPVPLANEKKSVQTVSPFSWIESSMEVHTFIEGFGQQILSAIKDFTSRDTNNTDLVLQYETSTTQQFNITLMFMQWK